MRLKRYVMPWKLPVKPFHWVVSPRPGPHPKDSCLPLLIILRDILKVAETGREAKKLIKAGKVRVDGKERREAGYPAGLMDVIEIENLGCYRVLPGEKGLEVVEIAKKDAGWKICRIRDKRNVKGGKIQLNLHDGRNILVDSQAYKPGDSVMIQIPEQKILKHYPLKVGQEALIFAGKNAGKQGKIKEIRERKSMLEKSTVILETPEGRIETLKDYIIVIGGKEHGKSDARGKARKGND